MKVFSGFYKEYKRRNDEFYSEMVEMLHKNDASNYSIFLHENTNSSIIFDNSIDKLSKRQYNNVEAIMQTITYVSEV